MSERMYPQVPRGVHLRGLGITIDNHGLSHRIGNAGWGPGEFAALRAGM